MILTEDNKDPTKICKEVISTISNLNNKYSLEMPFETMYFYTSFNLQSKKEL